MESLLVILIIVIIVGALLGGKSFGGTIRKGCGFFALILGILIVAFLLFGLLETSTSDSQQEKSTEEYSARFTAIDDCPIYSKPDIKSDSLGVLEVGQEFFVKEVHRFKYFYTITDENENHVYVRKKCLERN